MHTSGTQLSLLQHAAAFQNNMPPQAEDAPSANLLVRIARSPVALFLGSHTVQYFSGVMLGIGITLIPAGGIGIGLILAGSALLALSITLSAAALQDKDVNSIGRHLAKSLLCGAMGFGIGISAIPLTTISAVTHPGVGSFIATVAALLGSLLPIAMDADHRCDEARRATQIKARPIPTELKNEINRLLTTLFSSSEKVTVNRQLDDGEAVAIELNMEEQMDKMTSNPINGSTKEWIAVEKTPNCYDLFEASSFYDEAGRPRFTHHPYTRLPMHQGMIIRGQPLLNLLRQAHAEPTELATIHVTHGPEDGAQEATDQDK